MQKKLSSTTRTERRAQESQRLLLSLKQIMSFPFLLRWTKWTKKMDSEWTVEQERFEEIASNEESTPRDCRWLGFPTNKVRLFCLPSFLLWTINAYIGCTTHLTIWRVRQTRFPFRQIQYNSLSLSLMNLFLKWFAAPWYPKNKKYVWKVHWKYGNIIKTRFALQFEFVH